MDLHEVGAPVHFLLVLVIKIDAGMMLLDIHVVVKASIRAPD